MTDEIKPARKVVTPEVLAEMIRLYDVKKYTVRQVCAEMGYSYGAVYGRLRKNGVVRVRGQKVNLKRTK